MILVFTRRYSMAHRLWHAEDKCLGVHGHNSLVTVKCMPLAQIKPGPNMALNFAEAKGKWHRWIDDHVDHALQLNSEDPLLQYFQTHEPQRLPRIMVFSGDPTTEALVQAMRFKFSALCPQLNLLEVSVEETPTNTVTFNADVEHTTKYVHTSLRHIPHFQKWCRADDMSINDLSPTL